MRELLGAGRLVAVLAAATFALSGCYGTTETTAATYQQLLDSTENRRVFATWVWGAGSATPVTMRGLGDWEAWGTRLRWEEEWMASHTVVSADATTVTFDDGTRVARSSGAAVTRLKNDLFHSHDPLRIAAASELVLLRAGRSVRGEGGCVAKPGCRLKLEVQLDDDGMPTRVRLEMRHNGSTDVFTFHYQVMPR